MNGDAISRLAVSRATAADPVQEAICLNASWLVPAIARQHDTGGVAMMAWMNAQRRRYRRYGPTQLTRRLPCCPSALQPQKTIATSRIQPIVEIHPA
jgi:hypothetical protein